jgi:hypothetical protein
MNTFGTFYEIFESIILILIGIVGVFFSAWSVKINIQWALFLYRISKVGIYKLIADKINERKEDFQILVIIIGLIFIYLGIVNVI